MIAARDVGQRHGSLEDLELASEAARVIGVALDFGGPWTVEVGSFPFSAPGLFDFGVRAGSAFSIDVPPTLNSGGNAWEFPAVFFLAAYDGPYTRHSTYFQLDCGQVFTGVIDQEVYPWAN